VDLKHQICLSILTSPQKTEKMTRPILAFAISFLSSLSASAQKVTVPLKMEQGQEYEVTLVLKNTVSQQAMGQAIDFVVNGNGLHSFKVMNATEDNFTLHHEAQKIGFDFDGMGQSRKFDSNNEKDGNGPFGKPIKQFLARKYDMIVDPHGKVLLLAEGKQEKVQMDDRMAIITNMLRDVLSISEPPKKGDNSIFGVLPAHEVGVGDVWSDTIMTETVKGINNYRISAIDDATITIEISGGSTSTTKAEMMGNETTTTMSNKIKGTIIVDRNTGILKEKKTETESNGNTESTFGTLPVTAKTITTITVTRK